METFDYKKYSYITGIALGVALIILSLTIASTQKESVDNQAVITVTGEGEVVAKPDIATVTFTVRENAKTVPEAQKLTEAKVTKGLESLKTLGVVDTDVKTLSYNVSPRYVSSQIYCPMSSYCPTQTKIDGYDVAETIQVKIRKIDQAGEAIGLIGGANITEITGPDFTIDDTKKLEDQAKSLAINEAKLKAQKIAKDLGVRLGHISAYSENGGYYPSVGFGGAMIAKADSITVPQGETNVKVNVSVSYKIR